MSRPDDICTRCGKTGHQASQCKQPTTDARAHLPAKRNAATLAMLKGWCRVDAETGCWSWTGANANGTCPTVHIGGANRSAVRAAWLASGRLIPDGHRVWRSVCANTLCIRPDHCATGTVGEIRKACGDRGLERGQHRRIVNKRTASAKCIPVDVVREIERRKADGQLQKLIVAEMGVGRDTVRRVLAGLHMHSANRIPQAVGASVFSLGMGARR